MPFFIMMLGFIVLFGLGLSLIGSFEYDEYGEIKEAHPGLIFKLLEKRK